MESPFSVKPRLFSTFFPFNFFSTVPDRAITCFFSSRSPLEKALTAKLPFSQKALRSLRPRKGKAASRESLSDPLEKGQKKSRRFLHGSSRVLDFHWQTKAVCRTSAGKEREVSASRVVWFT